MNKKEARVPETTRNRARETPDSSWSVRLYEHLNNIRKRPISGRVNSESSESDLMSVCVCVCVWRRRCSCV